MAENSGQEYLVRDTQGNVYGPAAATLLCAWAAQGRIVPGMHISPKETGEWVEVSAHRALAGCFPTTSAGAATEPALSSVPAKGSGAGAASSIAPTAAAAPVTFAREEPRQNVLALLSMIFGIVAVLGSLAACVPVCGCVTIPVALTAIALGVVGWHQVKSDPQRYTGPMVAFVGLGLGVMSLILIVVLMALRAALPYWHM